MAIDIEVGSTGTKETAFQKNIWARANRVALSRTTSLPASVPDGAIYIIPVGDPQEGEVAFRTEGSWATIVPEDGWTAYVLDDTEHVIYLSGAWVADGGGVVAAEDVTYDPSGSGLSGMTNVQDAIDALDAIVDAIDTSFFELEIACSDETTVITTGTAKVTFYAMMNATISEVFTGITTQSASGSIVTNLKKNGSTMFSTKPEIQAVEDTSLTGVAAVLSVTTWTKGDKMTVDIDNAGVAAVGLKMIIRGTRT